MITRLVLSFIAFTLIGLSSAQASAPAPQTPAGRTLQAWLDAFNSGDRSKIQTYISRFDPSWRVSEMIDALDATGGYELESIEASEPLQVRFILTEKASRASLVGNLILKDARTGAVEILALHNVPKGQTERHVTVDSALRKRLIDGIGDQLADFYIDPDLAVRMRQTLQAKAASGRYDSINDGDLLADRLAKDLLEISHDKHIYLAFSPFPAPPDGPPSVDELSDMRKQALYGNCSFSKV